MKTVDRQAVNPYLPSWEYIPDGEPHVFNGRVYVYGSHDRFNAPIFCVNDYVCWSAPVEDLSDWRYEGVIYRKKQDPKNPWGYHLLFAPDVCQGPDGRYYLYYAFDFLGIMGVAVCDTPAGEYEFLGHIHYADGTLWGRRRGDQLPFDPGVLADDDGRVWLYSGFYNTVPAILTGGHKLRCDGGTVLELEKDMVTIKTEPRVIFPKKGPGAFQGHEFFEASSIRKEGKTYIFVYSSRHNHELCYATSQSPDRDFSYGGTLVSQGDIFLDSNLSEKHAANYLGNTHPKWEQLLDELTVNDLFSLTADGGYHTVGVESIDLSATEECDGPTGVHSNYNPAAGPSYPGSVMLACTWNQPLAKARGEQIAKECAEINCAGWYAPAMNIHRSAFGGRNFEYYSECGVLSGLTAAAEVSGATENGLICYVKHFAFNDQDNYRQNNICTWLNEQAAREIYLKAFEQSIKAGGMGVMTSMNAVGPVWAGGCKALLTNILRDEWGFHGAVITDAVVSTWYMDGNLAIRTGGTKMLAFNITNEFYRDLNSVGTVTAMRNAAHGTLYALANSFAVTRAVSVPKWVKTTYAVDAVVAIILVAWEICAIRKYRKAKKEDEDTEQ